MTSETTAQPRLVTREVICTTTVWITFDESKFTPEFFAEFNEHFFKFGEDLDEHAKHLAFLHVRRGCEERDFIEGYGPGADMGFKFRVSDDDQEVIAR